MVLIGRLMSLAAQTNATATPAAGDLSTPTPESRLQASPTHTPAPSPSPLAAVRLRVLDTAGNVNIRSNPSLESEILGTLAGAVEYQVLRNYYRWYEFRYDLSPNGRAWVYGDLVEIVGDRSQILVIENPADIVIAEPLQNNAQSGPIATEGRTIAISTIQADSNLSVELAEITALPTFTAPAATPVSITDQLELEATEGMPWTVLPPIVPIAVLAGLGIIGFLVNAIRR